MERIGSVLYWLVRQVRLPFLVENKYPSIITNTIKLSHGDEQNVNFSENYLTNQQCTHVQQGTAKLATYKSCLKSIDSHNSG